MIQPVTLPCYGIRLYPTGDGGAGISSDLHLEQPYGWKTEENDTAYDAAIDALESLVLAHYCAGVDVTTPAYIEGIETAVQAFGMQWA